MLVILGMTEFRELPKSPHLRYSSPWSSRAASESFGTVALASRLFDKWLLGILKEINADMTIVPIFADVKKGPWDFKLVSWNQSSGDQPYEFVPIVSENNNESGYVWTFDSQLRSGVENKPDVPETSYLISCEHMTNVCASKNLIHIECSQALGKIMLFYQELQTTAVLISQYGDSSGLGCSLNVGITVGSK